ncbi:MAG: ABC transporter ATP-binding protein/permease [Erysipelotrichaceae bacterium]|nr:ABC transporter ATP-binding protein/permease [Erysipelotrichaceae bacterium]
MIKYIKQYKTHFTIAIFFQICTGLISMFLALLMKEILDVGTTGNLSAFFNIVIYSFIFLAMYFLITLLKGITKASFLKQVMSKINEDLFKSIISFNTKTFNQKNSSEYISIFNNDLKLIETNYFENMFLITAEISQILICIITTIYFNYFLAIIIIFINILAIILPTLFSNILLSQQNKYVNSTAKLNVKLKDYLSAFELVKTNVLEKKVISIFSDYLYKNQDDMKSVRNTQSFIEGFSILCSVGVTLITILICIYFVIEGQITLGTTVAINQLVNNISGPLSRLSQQIASFKSVKEIQSKIMNIVDYHEPDNAILSLVNPIETIELRNISFCYDKDIVIDNASITFEKGKKYVLLGESGCGKSTLLKLICRIYSEYSGQILINNNEISTIKMDDLMKQIAYISQDTFIFNDTLKNNISLYTDYDNNKLCNVIKEAQLDVLVGSLSNGVDTIIGESATNVSGGEKQRIAIARALIKDASIIIIDEGTANLNKDMARCIEDIFLNNSDLMVIMVTHHFDENILRKYDEILYMSNGKIKSVEMEDMI